VENLERLITEHSFFKGMKNEHIRLLTGCASNVRFPKGSYIFREGETANTFYGIRAGRVALEIYSPAQGPLQIDTRKSGGILGWSWIVAPYRWYCDARVIEDVRALALDGACLRGKCEKDKNLGYELYTRFIPLMHRSLEVTRLQLMDVYGSQ